MFVGFILDLSKGKQDAVDLDHKNVYWLDLLEGSWEDAISLKLGDKIRAHETQKE